MPDDDSHHNIHRSMSLANLRDDLLQKRFSDRVSSLRRRSSRLRALNNVTTALTQHVGLPSAIGLDYHSDSPPPLTSDEERILDEYDLERGRYVTDASFQINLNALLTPISAVQSRKPAEKERRSVSEHVSDSEDDADEQPATPGSSAVHDTTVPTASIETPKTSPRRPPRPSSPSAKPSVDRSEKSSSQPDERQNALEPKVRPGEAVHVNPNGDQSPDSLSDSAAQHADAQAASGSAEEDVSMQDAPETASAHSPGEQLRREQEASSLASKKTDVPVLDEIERGRPSEPGVPPAREQHPNGLLPPPALSGLRPSEQKVATAERVGPASPKAAETKAASRASASKNLLKAPTDLRRSRTPMSPPRRAFTTISVTSPSQPAHSESEDVLLKLPADYEQGYVSLQNVAVDPRRDYLEPLYRLQAQDPPNGKSLRELLYKATKTVDSADQTRVVREQLDQRVLKRIYHMQAGEKWSLRHPPAAMEPVPAKTHIDHLLAEMRWMRTDFRSERKLKRSLASFFATQCAQWIASDVSHRREMQVTCRSSEGIIIPTSAEQQTSETQDLHSPAATTNGASSLQVKSDRPPELDATSLSADSPQFDADLPLTPINAFVPWSLLENTKLNDPLLEEPLQERIIRSLEQLPLLKPFDAAPDAGNTYEIGRATLPSVSKFSDAKLLAQLSEPSRKRSRYIYPDEDIELEAEHRKRTKETLPPESTDLALFDPENKVIRDRLHAQTAFRPPSEHPMPTTQFYEFRQSSQWTWDDDQKLKELAKDYSFNWGLISDEISSPSTMHSASDRRTPWECFERWIELESMPYEMRKTVYFRSWNQRVEAASRNVEARYQAQLQMHAQNGNQGPVPMRRRIQPMQVEKRRSSRHMHLVDAMRKLARKREQIQFKQAEAAKAASLRKQQEAAQPKPVTQTPQQYSRMRQEKDQLAAARHEQYREQMMNQQRAAQMQRSGQYASHQQAMAAIQQQKQRAAAAAGQVPQMQAAQPGVAAHNMQNLHPGQQTQIMMAQRNEQHLAVPNMGAPQNRPRPGMPGVQTAGLYNGQEAAAQMQGRPKSAQQHPGQQFQMQQGQRQQQSGQQHLSPGAMPNGMAGQHPMVAAAMQASNSQGGQMMQRNLSNHSNAASSQGASASPHMRAPMPPNQPGQLSSGLVPAITQIKHKLQSAHPQATPQQIDQMAAEQMQRHLSQQRQNAINAAAGGQGMQNGQFQQNQAAYMQGMQFQQNGHPNLGMMANANSPQQAQAYAAMMRQRAMQQQSQLQQAGNNANGSPRVSTPQRQQQMQQQQMQQQGTPNSGSTAQGSPDQNKAQGQSQQQPQTQGPDQATAPAPAPAPAGPGAVSLRMTPEQREAALATLRSQRSQVSQTLAETPQGANANSTTGKPTAGSPRGKAASMQPPTAPKSKAAQPGTQTAQ